MNTCCRSSNCLLALAAALVIPCLAAAQPLTEATLYARHDTWQASLAASWRSLLTLERSEADAAPTGPVQLGPWYLIGSFDNKDGKGFAAVYPPETEIALDQTVPGMSDSQATWRRMDAFRDGQIHSLNPHFRLTEQAIAYLYRKIKVKEPMEITGYFGSDDGLAVWLNGEKLISQDVPRGPAPDQDKATLKLKAGDNHLLLKIVNRTGGWGFYFSTTPGGGKPEENPTHVRRVNALWAKVRADFPSADHQLEMRTESADDIWPLNWDGTDAALARRYQAAMASHANKAGETLSGLETDLGPPTLAPERKLLDTLQTQSQSLNPDKLDALTQARQPYHQAARFEALLQGRAQLVSTGLAVADLRGTFGSAYPQADAFTDRAKELSRRGEQLLRESKGPVPAAALADFQQALVALQLEALVKANPLLRFDKLMYLTRRSGGNPGLPQNWQSNSSIGRTGTDTSINLLDPADPGGAISTLFTAGKRFVGDLCLSFDGQRLLFDMPAADKADRYQIFEIGADGQGLRMITASADNDYDNYDACYLPNGQIMFTSSRCYQAVPCTGGDHVALMYLMDADGSNVRQLTFDQDHSWSPRVLNDGRVIYSRWEYNDLPHYFSRLLFSMNPDGTRQSAFYGTNSWFPNTMMYARPVPGSNSKIVCILSGHHGNPRMGEVALIDAGEGEQENAGVTRILPGRHRKVDNPIIDQYATGQWPQFVHPYPLSDKYFLVSCKPSPDAPWGLYLLDVFDNLVPLRIEPGASLFEPIPLRPTLTPPAIPSTVDLSRKDATVYMYDVYRGAGLSGVPRGTVKSLRLVEPVYRYWGNGETHSTSIDGGWDVKRIWGTVPVKEDGSAYFRIPANTPILVQPLDSRGRAQQQMRSWFTAMPGETLSCVGCHEQRRETSSTGLKRRALLSKPSEITPWRGPARGFSFEREVQPVLDRNCVACHSSGRVDLRPLPTTSGRFSVAYETLHPYVRRPGLESDIHMLPPREFIADTSQLMQMLKKGHKGVKLGDEDWDRLVTWIDLNVPYAGDWRDAYPPAPENLIRRRDEIRAQDAAVRARQAAKR